MGHIFLYGPSGAGKTTVGRILSRDLHLPFVDTDEVIEQKAGMPIPKIMKEQGEESLRNFETEILGQIVDEKESVVALGGGALLRDQNRRMVETCGYVILLMAELPTLLERLQKDSNERPLLTSDLRSNLASYLEMRAPHYASFSRRLKVDGQSMERVSHDIQKLIGRHHLSAMGEYDVIVESINKLSYGSFVVTDENVAKFHLDKVKNVLGSETRSLVLPAGEAHKNLETISLLWNSFLESGLDRKSSVIALGGGVISDLTGFAASTYMRGIDWIAVPTTLLSMVDASIGGKTGFDLPQGKNLIGSFHPPKLVLADPSLLLTLQDRELISGMAEVVKHGILSDLELFELCALGMDWVKDHLDDLIKRAMAVKIQVIEDDPYEKGIRAALNLGHTVGHAVELVSQFEIKHGEAVAVGMVVEAMYGEKIGVTRAGLANEIRKTLSVLGLPFDIPRDLPKEDIIRAMRLDKKKNAKSVRLALPVEIGKVEIVEVSQLEKVLE